MDTGPVYNAIAAIDLVAVDPLRQIIDNLRGWIMGILWSIAALYGAIAGVLYLTANGDTAKLEAAKSAFRSTLIGVALALLSPLALDVLQSILGVDLPADPPTGR